MAIVSPVSVIIAIMRATRPIPPRVRRAIRELAASIRAWRKLRGLTQAQLADRAGIARDTVVRVERGDGGVSTENLVRLLAALGVLDEALHALDPYETDVGRMRAEEQLPQRVRPRDLRRQSDE